mmetsp:Transcript_7154/g.8056  ORF Transcript_7154/g.8056 Transcript_7154/m.8056 type:complete len:265 (+) Transcript_7154:28-822(+)
MACPRNQRRSGQTFIVTGGGSGLGEAAARLLISQGANVLIVDKKDPDEVEGLVKEFGARALFQSVDVTKAESVQAAVDTAVSKFGPLTGVINCAGIGSAMTTVGRKGPHSMDVFDFVMKVNLYGTFNLCRLGAAAMAKNQPDADGQRGVLINVASVAAYDGQKGQVAYAASKGAVVAMSLPMARDLAKFGIRVVCIAPGIMETPMMQMAPPKVREPLMRNVLSPHRFGQPEEFARLCESIIDNHYLNGECIRFDGGIRMPSGVL